MTAVAPEACLVGCRIDWSIYFEEIIEAVAKGEEFPQDWCKGLADGAVVLTPYNDALLAPGTAEKVEEVKAKIISGEVKVFDTKTFTVGGAEVTQSFALDTDGDFVPDSVEAIADGCYNESTAQSAPYFALQIDGIEWLNSAF